MPDSPANPYPDERDTTDYQISSRHGWIAALCFFPIVAAMPLLHHIIMAAQGKWAETPAARLISWRPSQGELLARLHETEKSTDDAVYSKFIRQTTQASLAWIASEGNRKVFIGDGGWLYYQPELTALRGWGPLQREPFSPMKDPSVAKLPMAKSLVLEFAQQLKDRGLPLLIVPLPVKPMIYPEYISAAKFRSPVYHADQAALYDQLRAAGIDVLDLAPAMWDLKPYKQVFLQQDTHWTPDAMKVLAEKLARHIKEKYPRAIVPPKETPLVNAKVAERTSFGDLVKLLDLRSPGWIFPQEAVELVPIEGLDPSAKSPIALLGDSFVNVFSDPSLGFEPDDHDPANPQPMRAGFGHHLSIFLNQPLDVIAVNGGGATDARTQLARRFDDEVRAKKLVVWVIACRDLLLSPPAAREANVKWERVEFNPNTSTGKGATVAATSSDTGGKIIVEARLVEKSKNQDPNGTPYEHALHTARYEVLKPVSGSFTATDWIAVQWTFKSRKLQPPANAVPGKTYRLTLVPESAMPADAKDKNTSDNWETDFTAERWWVEAIEAVR